MLTHNDLLDLYGVFCNIRINPSAEYNRTIISNLVAELDTEDNLNNKVKACARGIENLEKPFWDFVYIANDDKSIRLIEDPRVYSALKHIFSAMLKAIDDGNYDEVYRIADLAHNIPRDVLQNQGKLPAEALELLKEIG